MYISSGRGRKSGGARATGATPSLASLKMLQIKSWHLIWVGPYTLGWVIVPKVFIFTSTVIFPISYVPKVNLNLKYWIRIEIYYGFKPIKVLYYELLRGKRDIRILLQKSMKELNYWLQRVKVCLLGPPRLPKKIWGLWANILYVAQGAQIPQNGPPGSIEGVGLQTPNFFYEV